MMILTEGMNLEDVPAVVDRMGAEAETVDRAAEAPEMAVRMVVGQADGDRIHGDQAVVAQADLVQWDLQDHGDHRDFPDTRGPRVRQEPPGRPVPKGRQAARERAMAAAIAIQVNRFKCFIQIDSFSEWGVDMVEISNLPHRGLMR